jgi:hypothetical protein
VSGQGSHDHLVTFSSSDAELEETVSNYLLGATQAGGVAVVVATLPHRQQIEQRLALAGLDPGAARAGGSLVMLDAAETLDRFVVNGYPDPAAFYEVISPQLKRASRRHRQVRVFGEMVSLLWESGQFSAALDLEALWNGLARQYRFSLLCAYRANSSSPARSDELALMLGEHSAVTGRHQPREEAIVA